MSELWLDDAGKPLTEEQAKKLTVKPTDFKSDVDARLAAKRKAAAETQLPVETNDVRAFIRLTSQYTVNGSYPEKQSAIEKATETLGKSASVSELYHAAVAILES